jgi:hypothetical protein
MGDWGVGLYQGDVASDLRNKISLLAKLPASGERLLKILIETHHEGITFDDDDGPAFWLVVADQFERRGIACPKAFERALLAIDTGADLRDWERRDASSSDLKKRAKVLRTLGDRLRSPRPRRPRPEGKKPPRFIVDVGEVYSFPTMAGECFNPWAPNWDVPYMKFRPDGWGAMLILARGRVFDWFPWCTYTSLTVDASRRPSLADAAKARCTTDFAQFCVPRRSHMKRMKMELLGRIHVDPEKAAAAFTAPVTPQQAVLADWSFYPRGWESGREGGVAVSALGDATQL